MNWLYFATLGGSRWGYKIVNAISNIDDEAKYSSARSLIGHIHFRLNVINELINISNEQFLELHRQSEGFKNSDLFSSESTGVAIHVDNSIRYRVSSSIHSIFYEINTCCELLEELGVSILADPKDTNDIEEARNQIRNKIVEHSDDNGMWFRRLDNFRNYFTHEGTVSLAISVEDMKIKDLLILKQSTFEADKKNDFITLKEIGGIVSSFWSSTRLIDEYLASKIS